MYYDMEVITQEFAFGKCRRCEGPPNGLMFGHRILWALCGQCKTAWWVICSHDGWDKHELRVRELQSALAGWDIGHNDLQLAEALAKGGWDIGGGAKDAYEHGCTGENFICTMYGLPIRGADLTQPHRAPDGTPIHVRTAWSPAADLALRPYDAEQDDINVLLAVNMPLAEAIVLGWWGGPPSQQGRRPQLKGMNIFPLERRA